MEAIRNRAPSAVARSSRLSVPIEPTRRISTGIVPKSVGLAGDAMCMIASNRSAIAGWCAGRPSVMSASISVNRGLSAR